MQHAQSYAERVREIINDIIKAPHYERPDNGAELASFILKRSWRTYDRVMGEDRRSEEPSSTNGHQARRRAAQLLGISAYNAYGIFDPRTDSNRHEKPHSTDDFHHLLNRIEDKHLANPWQPGQPSQAGQTLDEQDMHDVIEHTKRYSQDVASMRFERIEQGIPIVIRD